MICKIIYDVIEDSNLYNVKPKYWIEKSLFLFNKKIYAENLPNFYDVKEGKVPFLIKEDASYRCKIMRMLEDENPFPFITDEFSVEDDFENKILIVKRNRVIFGYKYKSYNIESFNNYDLATYFLNELYDKKYVR